VGCGKTGGGHKGADPINNNGRVGHLGDFFMAQLVPTFPLFIYSLVIDLLSKVGIKTFFILSLSVSVFTFSWHAVKITIKHM